MQQERHQLKLPLCRVLLLVALSLLGVGRAYAQGTSGGQPAGNSARSKAISFTFISPNTRENLTLEEAIKLLNSPEELRLLGEIQRLSLCLGVKSAVWKSIGSWSDGAEHAAVFRTYVDHQKALYEAAQLGMQQRQKSVLYFRQSVPGAGRMYVLSLRRRRPLASISRALDRSGVMFRTLVPARRRPAMVYVVDLDSSLQKQVRLASRRLAARLRVLRGTGGFIGDDADREKARAVYADAIQKYEAANPDVARKCGSD